MALLGTLTTHDATPAARDALNRLLAWEASRNGINPEATEAFVNPVSGATITSPNIAGHRDYAATACPGDTFYPTLPAIRRDVAALIAGSTPAPDTTGTMHAGPTSQPASTIEEVVEQLQQRIDAMPRDQLHHAPSTAPPHLYHDISADHPGCRGRG